ncbi:outer membrane protein assembly factor BamE (lipoprotein component of BamABCDE complex) [Sulfitobacter undariae]|uniref:Outer membrane protein assembly factor BamE (Lipoprotein component of BamABCDE complex) n=1 Tax=Sulfitobacter undariae TaxID=1563671 RepID=A0A7W6E8A5_9RHOB|nr:outer membrane protein assembly factor BamE [Sulfitobacter undariae]MBB3993885.1 outer membrane protein assembly factor BamE (lipoprotein component of BamABCDE complex) [Sulfitobacter undariae]
MGIFNNTGITRRVLFAAVLLGSVSACSPQYANHGYLPPEEDLDQIVVGVDTRDSVAQSIGTPSTAGVANDSGYYYVRSRRRTVGALAPKVIERQVLAISFDSAGVVSNIEKFGMERGQVVPLSRRVTTAGVRDNSFLRQLLGNIGRFNPAGLGG